MSQWISDGSNELSVNKGVVTHRNDNRGDNVFNYMWQEGDGVSCGKHYWKIHFQTLEDGAGVGVTSKDHFKKGYACKGLKYLGNLSDGGRLLVSRFGPSLTEGDVIGILAVFEDDRLKVYIDLNGRSLGLAFDVPASIFKTIFPFISFRKSGSATCAKQTHIPNFSDRSTPSFTGINGDWQLITLQENGSNLILNSSPTCEIRNDGTNKYSWFVKVANNISTSLSLEEGNWKTCGTLSTKMLSTPEVMKIERTIICLMDGLKQLNIEASGHLSVKSDNISSIWARYHITPRTFVGNPFA